MVIALMATKGEVVGKVGGDSINDYKGRGGGKGRW